MYLLYVEPSPFSFLLPSKILNANRRRLKKISDQCSDPGLLRTNKDIIASLQLLPEPDR
jgi:hypothetical protein